MKMFEGDDDCAIMWTPSFEDKIQPSKRESAQKKRERKREAKRLKKKK